MIPSCKVAAAGILLVAMAVTLVGVQSKATGSRDVSVPKQHVHYEDDRIFIKRETENAEVDSNSDEASQTKHQKPKQKRVTKKPRSRSTTKKPKTTTKSPNSETTTENPGAKSTSTNSPSHTSTHGPTTTKGPTATSGSTTTSGPTTTHGPKAHRDEEIISTVLSTRKPGSPKSLRERGFDADSMSLLGDSLDDDVGGIRGKMSNRRWLQKQETVAIEHMIAGISDWIKVLRQTRGRTYNRSLAGEFFDKANRELIRVLRREDKPRKLMAYYRSTKYL